MKHVCIFDERSRAAVYGIGTYIRQLISCLANVQDISLHIIRLRSDEKEFKREQMNGYIVYYFPELNQGYGNKFQRYYQNAWCLFTKYLRIARDDKLIFQLNYFQHYTFLKLMKETYPDCYVLFAIHYQNWCFSLNGNVRYFKRIIHNREENALKENEKNVLSSFREEKKIFNEMDHIICLSEFTQNLLAKEYGIAKTTLVYNGLKDEGKSISEERKRQIKRRLFMSEQEKIILFVGRLDKIKGVDVLIKALRYVLKEMPDSRLVIVGDGDFSTCLKECKGFWHRITFTGQLAQKELYDFYRIADVGVMPSTHEQCSYVGIEMMMFGLPMVISTSTGLSEMLTGENEQYKIRVKEKREDVTLSAVTLKNKIVKTFSDPDYKRRIRKQYEDKYTLDSMKKKYEEIYARLISTLC